MLKTVTGLQRHSVCMSVEAVARATSMTSMSVSVPTTTTGTCSDSATANAVDTIRVFASASAYLTRMPVMSIFSRRACISLILFLLLARKAAWVVVVGMFSSNMLSL